MPIVVFLFIALLFGNLSAQDFRNEDCIYNPNIKSIQFTIPGLQTAFPIINLGDRVQLDFDEINGDARYLQYRIEHCNADWSPSDLEQMEYLEGFNDEEIREFAFSVNTKIPYTHYSLELPNQDVNWTKSGNYMLHVYDSNSGEPLFSRRFCVVESKMKIDATLQRPADVSKIRTHVEIDFEVNHKGIYLRNPLEEVQAVVLQNGRWDRSISQIPPFRFQGEDLLFDHQDRIVFPGGKEFRNVDFRSLRNTSRDILEIDEYQDAWEVKLMLDEKRTFREYLQQYDLNGQYVIESYNDRNYKVESDYVYLLFSLASSAEIENQDVYVIGKFSDWEVRPENKMEYTDQYGAYFGEILLKQGVYDYEYVSVPRNGTGYGEDLEGSWHETGNYYTILVYYRPFGGRYDQLVSVGHLE
ncbi:MAG: DUF5103 domain-containing protein [Saprospiraceae bacterium]|nr:DUF5103 domain-containing protein [Saprospiraceae bacterium]